jgi:hypothetical protein
LKLLLDEHIWPGMVPLLKRMLQGLDVVSIHDFCSGRLMNCDDGIILRECILAERVLVTFDVNSIPWRLGEMAVDQEDHAGVVFFSAKSCAQNDYAGLARSLVQLVIAESDSDWTNRVVFVSRPAAL